MDEPIITTVIPTFRRPDLLRRSIESVLSQSFKDLIVCVYDNASGDETEKVVSALAKRDSRVRYFRNEQNIGPVLNVVKGISAVNTPYYSLLSDDDFLLPGFYEDAVKGFKSHPKAGFVCSKTVVIDLIENKLQFLNKNWVAGAYEPSNEIVSKMYSSHFVTTGVLLSSKLRDGIGVFESSGSDSLYMTIAAGTFPFVVLEKYGAAVTLHESAYSMVGEGIAKENVHTLYEHLLSTIGVMMKLNIPDDRKLLILMHVLKSYQQHFDTKKLNYLMNKKTEEGLETILGLPSLITNRGLVSKLYGYFPEKIHSWVTSCFRLTQSVKKLFGRKTRACWVDIPEEASVLLDGKHSDMAKLMPYLQPKP